MMKDHILHFQEKILCFYEQQGRQFAWRSTKNPYHILVSEFMLQQTQTYRVEPKYEQFLRTFPKIQDCANAPLSDILVLWQGLGYNRRAKYLHQTTKIVLEQYDGVIPCDPSLLSKLPGIGAYTAAAVCTFSFNKPFVFIETNIRTVFINEFFRDPTMKIHDKEIIPLIEKTLPTENPREWYYALMDYGTFLKKTGKNPSIHSVHYTKQSTFKGSKREIRGMIIKILTQHTLITKANLELLLEKKDHRFDEVLESLIRDGLIHCKNDYIQINNG